MSASTSRSRACSRRAWWCTRPTASAARQRRWVAPAEVRIEDVDGKRRAIDDRRPAKTVDDRLDREDVEVEEERRRSRRHHRQLRRRHRALVHAVRFAARARRRSGPRPASKARTASSSASGAWCRRPPTRSTASSRQPAQDGEAGAVSKAAHKTLKAVGEDIDKLGFNSAVARIYELVNALDRAADEVAEGKADRGAGRRAAARRSTILVRPGRADDAASGRGMLAGARRHGSGRRTAWPVYDPALVVDNEITLPVQVNGKKRGDLTIARDADQAAVEKAVLALDFVQKALEGKAPEDHHRAAEDRQCRCLSLERRRVCCAVQHCAAWSPRSRWFRPAPCVRSIRMRRSRRLDRRRRRRTGVDLDQAGQDPLRPAGAQQSDFLALAKAPASRLRRSTRSISASANWSNWRRSCRSRPTRTSRRQAR